MRWQTGFKIAALVALVFGLSGIEGHASFSLPGVIPPSGCFTSAVLSTDQFTSTGFSQVRTVGPGDETPAGAWVLVDDRVPSTSLIGTTNCPAGGVDGLGTFVVGLKLTPTIGNWQDADIQELKLIQDMNCNGLFEDGLDSTMQIRQGSELQASKSVTFFNGPQSSLFRVASAGGGPAACGTSAAAIMVVVKIGPNPLSGSQFGLMLEAAAADVPGQGIISSGFSSSLNPAGSSIRLQIVGGGSGTPPPPPPPPSGTSPLKQYDTNNNDLVDDQEFFTIIDAWINNQLDDTNFFKAIDLWVSQSRISSAALRPRPVSLEGVSLASTGGGIAFAVRGQGIASLGVEVFSLSGQRVFSGEVEGRRLVWPLSHSTGGLVANGIYLYRVTIRGADGHTLAGEIQKLLVRRS